MNFRDLAPRAVDLEEALQGSYATEQALQDAIHSFLEGCEREVDLEGAGRIDFLTRDGIGVEAKIEGSIGRVLEQLFAYAGSPRIEGLLLVTTRRRHAALPLLLRNKPLAVVVVGYV